MGVVRRWRHNDSAAFLILQDDTMLAANWTTQLPDEMAHVSPAWERVLLVWWGMPSGH